MEHPFDCAIVGGGPGGLSAALLLGRARRRTIVLDAGNPRNISSAHVHGFFSRDGANPKRLLEEAREQLRRYPDVVIQHETVTGVTARDNAFTVTAHSGKLFSASRLMLATGVRDELPSIDGLQALWGKSVFTCPYCDGWEFRDRRIAIHGSARDGIRLAQTLSRCTSDIVLCAADLSGACTDDLTWLEKSGISVRSSALFRVSSQNGRTLIEFADADSLECAAIFLSVPLVQRSDLPAAIGCRLDEDGGIVVDECGRTTVRGCYAAGDAANRRHQVAIAAASGLTAATAVNEDLLEHEVSARLASR